MLTYLVKYAIICLEIEVRTLYFTVKQQLKRLSKQDYENLRELCHTAKNLANEAIYNVRQYYFNEHKYLNYEKNYQLLKSSENYKLLNSNVAQQILKEVDGCFKSFFALLKKAKQGTYKYSQIRLPGYLPKDGFTTLIIGFVRLKGNKLVIPFSQSYKKQHDAITIVIPPVLIDKKIKEIRIIPKGNARFFEIQYTYEVAEYHRKLNTTKALALDFGVSNLITAVDTDGHTFIVDGKRLKSINQYWNKQNSRLQSIKDHQYPFGFYHPTVRQYRLHNKRNCQVNDYMSKAARIVINYCLEHDIGNLIVGYHTTFQESPSMKNVGNQNFVNIPFGKLRDKLEYLCVYYGIQFTEQEESYTSKASFFDQDEIPVYNNDHPVSYTFSGKRVKRGLYRTKSDMLLNADVNGALNIMRKSMVVPDDVMSGLYRRGGVDTPVRIRVA